MTPPPKTLTEEDRELAILEAERLLELCRTEQHEGNFAKAKEGAEQALVVFSTHHHKSGILSVKSTLGHLALAQHRFPEAIVLFNECMALASEIGNQRVISVTLGHLAAIYTRQKQFDRAHVNLSEALSIAEKHGQELRMGEVLHRMGNVYCKKAEALQHFGDAEGAQAALAEARRLALKLGVSKESELGQAIARLEAHMS